MDGGYVGEGALAWGHSRKRDIALELLGSLHVCWSRLVGYMARVLGASRPFVSASLLGYQARAFNELLSSVIGFTLGAA